MTCTPSVLVAHPDRTLDARACSTIAGVRELLLRGSGRRAANRRAACFCLQAAASSKVLRRVGAPWHASPQGSCGSLAQSSCSPGLCRPSAADLRTSFKTEGPSGIGKTLVAFKIFEELAWVDGTDYSLISC
jgi:hypothetical protein